MKPKHSSRKTGSKMTKIRVKRSTAMHTMRCADCNIMVGSVEQSYVDDWLLMHARKVHKKKLASKAAQVTFLKRCEVLQ